MLSAGLARSWRKVNRACAGRGSVVCQVTCKHRLVLLSTTNTCVTSDGAGEASCGTRDLHLINLNVYTSISRIREHDVHLKFKHVVNAKADCWPQAQLCSFHPARQMNFGKESRNDDIFF